MQKGDPVPKIIHTNIAKQQRKFTAVMTMFTKAMVVQAPDMVGKRTFEVSDENLLKHRKALVARIKEGMLERKDMELEIATLAAIVWFLRLDKKRQEQVEGLW